MHDAERESLIRQLEMTDRILGLEAEIAQLKITSGINDLRHVRGSRSWKLGNFILRPAIYFKGMLKRLTQGR